MNNRRNDRVFCKVFTFCGVSPRPLKIKTSKLTTQKTPGEYGVAALALQTELSTLVVRIWEKRYSGR